MPGAIVRYNGEMTAAKPPITDSPWFWACLFASAGLVVLGYFSGQYEQRQLRIERQGQARMRAVEIAVEGQPRTEVSTPDNLRLPLRPIFVILAVMVVVGWAMFWRQRTRTISEAGAAQAASHHHEQTTSGIP